MYTDSVCVCATKKSTFINLTRDICAHNFRDPAIKLRSESGAASVLDFPFLFYFICYLIPLARRYISSKVIFICSRPEIYPTVSEAICSFQIGELKINYLAYIRRKSSRSLLVVLVLNHDHHES